MGRGRLTAWAPRPGEYGTACSALDATRGLLQRFKELPAFQHLESEINTLVVELEGCVRARLSSLDSSFPQVSTALSGCDRDGVQWCGAEERRAGPGGRGAAADPRRPGAGAHSLRRGACARLDTQGTHR